MKAVALTQLASAIASVTIDRQSVPQHQLDLETRVRTSMFPWRGQFSPGLIDLILGLHTEKSSVIVDPFVGSGTTLFEASRRNLECYGGEINPAASHFARVATLACFDTDTRKLKLAQLDVTVEKRLAVYFSPNVFRRVNLDRKIDKPFATALQRLIFEKSEDEFEHTILASSLLTAMGDEADLAPDDFEKAYSRVKSIVLSLPYSRKSCRVFDVDARKFPLSSGSVDLVITSPPYINVFNYHQNYRKAVELMGWDVLEVARSEIGANRKHRQNRLLTVIQYCMDMLLVLTEMNRLLKDSGRAVITIGRESNVRKTSFANGQLLAMLATDGAGFKLETWRERKFTNRFGAAIYEDILTLVPARDRKIQSIEFARSVAVWALQQALINAADDIAIDIESAINGAANVSPSPTISYSRKVGDVR